MILKAVYFLKDKKIIDHVAWFREKGDSSLKFDFPLGLDSVVVLVGGHKGDIAEELLRRFNCKVYVFEPVLEFYQVLENRFSTTDKVRTFNFGLGNHSRKELISVSGTGSTIYYDKSNILAEEEIEIRHCGTELFNSIGIGSENIDLLWLNAEGAEFEIMPIILSTGMINQINSVLIQFHTVFPNAKQSRLDIRKRLTDTHQEIWCYEFVWERWDRLKV